MKYIDFGLYEYLIIKMLDDCHKYSSLPEVNFFFIIMKIKVLVVIFFNNGNRSGLLLAVKVSYADSIV